MRNRKQIRQAGFTLIETLITIIILSIIMGAVFKQIDVAQKRSSAEQQKLDMFQESREFGDMMTRDLRNAGYPNSRNFDGTAVATDVKNAQGLLYVGPADVWFEGAVDGDGAVYVVKYHLDTTGTDCPCLRRSKVTKQAYSLSATDNYSVEVQYVQNGTLTLPIFTYYDASNNPLDLSSYTGNVIDGTLSTTLSSDKAKIASIQTIKIELSTQAKFADLQTGQRPVVTLDSFVTLPNCSQLNAGGTLHC
jgi:prepilin-type N-terminal cleavage/methylation domain-containing protein